MITRYDVCMYVWDWGLVIVNYVLYIHYRFIYLFFLGELMRASK